MVDLPLLLHAGATRYLEQAGAGSGAKSAPGAAAIETAPVTAFATRGLDISVRGPGSERVRAMPQSAPAMTLAPDLQPRGETFVVYFNFDHAQLSRDDFTQIAAACGYAAGLPRARFLISGHTDLVGPADYNHGLTQRRAQAVATAIRNDERFREALSVIELGEKRPAIPTQDEVSEPRNRRVEITVLPDER